MNTYNVQPIPIFIILGTLYYRIKMQCNNFEKYIFNVGNTKLIKIKTEIQKKKIIRSAYVLNYTYHSNTYNTNKKNTHI